MVLRRCVMHLSQEVDPMFLVAPEHGSGLSDKLAVRMMEGGAHQEDLAL